MTLAAERIKLTTTRSPLWLTVTAAVLSLALAGLQGIAAAATPQGRRSAPLSASQSSACRS